jgi:hypothetical protein
MDVGAGAESDREASPMVRSLLLKVTTMARALLVVLGFLLTLPAGASAQFVGGRNLSAGRDPFAGIRLGQGVRWTEPDSGRREGTLEGRTDTSVLVRTWEVVRGVPTSQVDSVWGRGHSGARGALIGAIVGGVMVARAAVDFSDSYGGEDKTSAGMLGAAVGAAGGAILGAIVGLAIPRWKLQVP